MPKRNIDVRKQTQLSLAHSFQICMRGIRHRFTRSMLTLAVVLLAVAFFMVLLSENSFIRSGSKGVRNEIAAQREAILTLNKLYNPVSSLAHSKNLAAQTGNIEETSAITGWSPERIDALARNAAIEQRYFAFFDSMDIGKRLILIEKNNGRDIFTFLADETRWAQFQKDLEPLRSLKLPTPSSKLRALLDHFPTYLSEINAFTKAWNDKVASLSQQTGQLTQHQEIERWLTDVPTGLQTAWRNLTTRHGFNMDPETSQHIIQQLRDIRLRDEIAQTLNAVKYRERWHQAFLKKPTLDEKLLQLDHKKVVEILENKYTRKQLRKISEQTAYENRLAKLEKALKGKTQAKTGSILSGRQIFLLCISFLVCMVGITNAMLMAITERFREIATMKCLGATDGFILTQFMIEAGLQGVVGGVIGMLIGLILSMLKNSFLLGDYLYRYFPWGSIFMAGFIAMAVGILLSVLASIYPSWTASRMAPMEAMRVE